ncbi:MAG: hypothetical protein WBG54_20365 [Acidobacteriaceae bacterium]
MLILLVFQVDYLFEYLLLLVHLVGEAKHLKGAVAMSDKTNECNVGLDDRCQDHNGEIRRKRSDTLVGTLRETYGPGFAPGVRSDAKLGTLLDRTGSSSLSEYRKKPKK